MKIINVVGARPNLMKIAPIVAELSAYPQVQQLLVHTGQHYDDNMSAIFFRELGLPEPDIHLGVGSASHARQTAAVMVAFEQVLLQQRPDLVVVVGDVNSTLACALTAVKLHIPVAHVEAGLRSFDRSMPEEINRVLTDAISDWLFTSCADANENLRREGVPESRIFFVGNVMIDTLLRHRDRALERDTLRRYDLVAGYYGVVTLHRPSNVDDQDSLAGIVNALAEIQNHLRLIFPMHPRTRHNLQELGLADCISALPNVTITEPLGYLDFLNLMSNARLVLTDSGGIQEETTILGVPCLTLRPNTERPVTVMEGTNTVVGTDRQRIVEASLHILQTGGKQGRRPALWDGHAAQRIVATLLKAELNDEHIALD